jgi:hypothetical protein
MSSGVSTSLRTSVSIAALTEYGHERQEMGTIGASSKEGGD